MTRLLPRKCDLFILILLSIVGSSAFYVLLNFGVQLSSPDDASLIVAIYPLITSLLAWRFLKEHLTGWQVAGIIMGLTGAFFIFIGGKLTYVPEHLFGKLAALGASLAFSVYVVTCRNLAGSRNFDPTYLTFNSFFLSIPVLLVLSVLFQARSAALRVDSIIGVLWLGVACSGGAFLLMNRALRSATTATVTSYLMIFPVVAVVSSFALLAQVPSLFAIVGGSLVIIGVGVAHVSGRAVSA